MNKNLQNGFILGATLQGEMETIEPQGEIEITENGTYDVSAYAEADVNVEANPYLINVTFMNGENEYAKVGVTSSDVKINKPDTDPEGEGVFAGWGLGSSRTPIQFPYTAIDGDVFNALYSSLADRLYSFYSVDKNVYPKLFILYAPLETKIVVTFASDFEINGERYGQVLPTKWWYYSNVSITGEYTAENIGNYLLNATKPSMFDSKTIDYMKTGHYVISNFTMETPEGVYYERI